MDCLPLYPVPIEDISNSINFSDNDTLSKVIRKLTFEKLSDESKAVFYDFRKKEFLDFMLNATVKGYTAHKPKVNGRLFKNPGLQWKRLTSAVRLKAYCRRVKKYGLHQTEKVMNELKQFSQCLD